MANTPYVSSSNPAMKFTGLMAPAATDYLGFYGATPIVQPASANQAAVTVTLVTALATTVFSEAKTGMWAFGSSTAAQLFRTRINQAKVDIGAINVELTAIRAALVSLGLIKGAA